MRYSQRTWLQWKKDFRATGQLYFLDQSLQNIYSYI